MTTFCKLFRIFCIVFSAAFFVVGAGTMAEASNSIFTVDNVVTDVEAANAIAARENAFQQAQEVAFKKLAQRMLSRSELIGFESPTGLALSALIQDYEVRDEKLSAKRYSAIYKFRFKSDKVRDYFDKSGANYSDVASKPLLILPFVQKPEGGVTIWADNNEWLKAWNNVQYQDALVPVLVPIGDLMDVNDIGDDEALTYSSRRLQAMLRRYNASEAVIAFAKEIEGDKLEVQIYRTDREQPEYVHQILQPIFSEEVVNSLDISQVEKKVDMTKTYDEAVTKVREALREDWKEKTIVQSTDNGSGRVAVVVQYNSINEWTQIQRALGRVDAINDIEIRDLSSREAYLLLSYRGGFERLNIALQQADMNLFTRNDENSRQVVYDLAYRKFGSSSYKRVQTSPPAALDSGAASPGGFGENDRYNAQF